MTNLGLLDLLPLLMNSLFFMVAGMLTLTLSWRSRKLEKVAENGSAIYYVLMSKTRRPDFASRVINPSQQRDGLHFKRVGYALQIDSHMRMVKGWDTLLKGYLQQCKDPRKAIISVYPRAYNPETFSLPETLEGPLFMGLKEFSKIDGLPRFQANIINKAEHFQKPFASLFWAAGFSFSYGALIEECGYTEEVDDVFFGEEIYLMSKFFEKGYQLYAPPKTIIYHLWDRAYRRTYKEDHGGDAERVERQKKCLERIRERIIGDEAFLGEMKRNRGVDLLARTFTQVAELGGLD